MLLTEVDAALSPEELLNYDRDGFVIVRNVFFREEIAALAREADDLVGRKDLIDSLNLRCRWQNHVETGECLFECFDPVVDVGPVCASIARDPRIVGRAAAIYGEAAHLFKDKLIFKPPGAKGYGLHQDYIGWKSFPKSFITVLVAVDPSTDGNGCTKVFPGRHREGFFGRMDGEYHETPAAKVAGVEPVSLALEPGDVAFFGALTPHFSAPNRSQDWRRQLYLSYNADSEGGEQRDAHYAEFQEWLRKKYAEYGKTGVYFR